MTANPLKSIDTQSRPLAPSDPVQRKSFWIERGNSILWGREPTSKGDFLEPKPNLQWVCVNGSYFIELRR